MTHSDVNSAAAKLELALKVFRTTFTTVEAQWTDAARRDFQENYVATLDPNVDGMLDAIARLAEVLVAAEHQCSSEYEDV